MKLPLRTISVIFAGAMALIFLVGERELPAPPVLVIDQPLPYSVARPFLHVRARALSTTDSTRIDILNGSSVVATFYDSVDNEINFSAFEGSSLTLTLRAIDRNGAITTSNGILIYVESSHKLIHHFTAPDKIIDVRDGKALTDAIPSAYPAIRNIVTGDSTFIPVSGPITAASLTPFGALLETTQSSGTDLMEYHQGILIPLGPSNTKSSVVKGGFASWTRQVFPNGIADSVFQRNLATGETKTVYPYQWRGNGSSPNAIDVTDKGVVAFTDSFNNVRSYDNGTYKMVYQLALPGLESAYAPVTDGHHTLFINNQYYYNMIRIDGDLMNRELTEQIRGSSKMPVIHYQVVNGFYAYKNLTTRGANSSAEFHDVLTILDSVGNATTIDSQLSYKNIQIDRLGTNGEIMYFRDGRRLGDRQASTMAISSILGKAYQMSGAWYVAIGRELFKVDLNPAVVSISNAQFGMKADSLYFLPPSLFIDHFASSRPLNRIRITGLPSRTTLTLSGRPVKLNDEIPGDSLAKLQLRSIWGTDTIQWNASDGQQYADQSAYLAVQAFTVPPIPLLAGLKESNCKNDGVLRVRIINYPDSFWHYIVQPSIDGNGFAASMADSSIYLNTANLDTGEHTLHVQYQNIAGFSHDTLYFRVNDTSTVTLALHTNLTHVTSSGPSATLTATSEKGGNAPLYTFAADRTFQTILQAQGSLDTYTVDATKLQVGDNLIYARVLSNAPCPLTPTAMDSIVITRDAVTGLYDPDQPGRQIMVFPNPTLNDLHLTGLLPNKSYTLKLVSSDGRVLCVQAVKGSTNATLDTRNLSAGSYFLRIQDDTKRKLLGTLGIMKK